MSDRGSIGWGAVAIGAICGAVCGFLLGLLFATISGGKLNDTLRQNERLSATIADLKGQVEDLRKQAHELDAVRGELAAEVVAHQAASENWIRSQALLGFILDAPAVVDFLRTEGFRQKFTSPWYAPEAMYKTVGARWFTEECIASEVLPPDYLEQLDRQAEDHLDRQEGRLAWTLPDSAGTTEPFHVDVPAWRLTWQVTEKRALVPRVMIVAYRDNGQVVHTTFGDTGNSSVIRTSPGDFYLAINCEGATADVCVEDVLP